MTAPEMKYHFEVLLDKITNNDAPGFNEREVSLFLSKAQERLVKSYYNPISNKLGEGFEETEKRSKDLEQLVKGPTSGPGSSSLVTSKSSDQGDVIEGGVMFDIPGDVMFMIKEEALTDELDCDDNKKVKSVKPVSHDYISANMNNPFKKPSTKVWRVGVSRSDLSRRQELITDGSYNVEEYRIRYLKKPSPVIVGDISSLGTIEGQTAQKDSELNNEVHREIIDMAVEIALETIQDDRLVTAMKLNQENE